MKGIESGTSHRLDHWGPFQSLGSPHSMPPSNILQSPFK